MATKSSFTRLGKGSTPSASVTPAQTAVKFPPGTRPSVHNGQLLISTGLNELDGKNLCHSM